MGKIQDSQTRRDLCLQLVADPDPAQRAEAIAHVRSLIDQEWQTPQTPENYGYLRVAEMVFDFLERTLESPCVAAPESHAPADPTAVASR